MSASSTMPNHSHAAILVDDAALSNVYGWLLGLARNGREAQNSAADNAGILAGNTSSAAIAEPTARPESQ